MELVDKWETEGKITDANRIQINSYFTLFEQHISPNSNALIVIVELKRLFQGSMSLEDFQKTFRLVKEAEYPEGDTQNRVLRDTIISRLAFDKIQAKVIKEGKDVTLARVMEIAQLEVSTQRHIDRMQETAKVNYVQYGKGSKKSKGKSRPSGSSGSGSGGGGGSSVNAGNPSKPSGKGRKVPLPTDICWRCGKGRHQKGHPSKAVEAVCRSCGTKGYYEKVCMKKSTHLVNIPATSTNSEPDYFNEHGDPVYVHTHMVHVKEIRKKHPIQFPIDTNFKKVRNFQEKCPAVLPQADTGADVNFMNSTTFDQIIGDRSIILLTLLRMEAYGNNTEVQVLGRFYAFLRWKGRIYRQLFYVTNANASHNLLSRDGCYTLGVLKSCYSVDTSRNSSRFQGKHQAIPTQPKTDLEQCKMHGDSFLHLSNEGTERDQHQNSMKQTILMEQHQNMPLTKEAILEASSNIFTGIGKFPGDPYKFQLKPDAKPAKHAPR